MKTSDVREVARYDQKSYMLTASFRFHTAYLEYSSGHWGQSPTGFNLSYDALPGEMDYKTYSPKPPAILSTFALMAGLCLWEMFSYGPPGASGFGFIGGLFLFTWALVLAERRWWRKSCTILPTSAGNIGVARDKQHDTIMAELQARRAAALMKYAVVDDFANPWPQLKQFKFLLEQSIITDEQFAAYRERLLTPRDEPAERFCGAVGSSRSH